MSECPSCGAAASPDLRYCLSCGTSLTPASCPACGAERIPGARFCGQCGTKLDGEEGAAAPAPTPEPVRTTERRLVSVLFADLVGFTSRAEAEDPEAVREFLSDYFDRAAEVIGRYGGTVEKFIGDAVMAVWGSPTAHEDDAERAVRAALDLVAVVRELGDGTELRAAITTGEAAVSPGATGQGLVAGDLVNTSSRLQSAAASGTILVDETTMGAAGRAIAFDAAGEFALKGKSEPVRAWTALRVVAERGGSGRRDALEPPFVGRHDELATLKEALHATGREGKARLVTVIGQAGLGKSRLGWELKKYSDGVMESVYWHEGNSPAYGEGVAYWALGEMVRTRCHVTESDSTATVRARLTETVAELISDEEERAWVEPRLAALLGVADAPGGDRDELFAAWRTFFERIAEKGTVALIFEDLHWAEESLYDFIEQLLEWSRDHPILVIGLARPELLERRTGWGSSGATSTTIPLQPLVDDAMGDLLRGLVPGLPEATLESIVSRAEGVPLYAVEIVRMLIDEGSLVHSGERYRLLDDSTEIAVPASLQALVAARLDALDPDERALVQDAAVLGKSFGRSGLAAVSGRDADALEVSLRQLIRKDILTNDSGRPASERGRYAFVQSLLRDVAYSTLSRRDRLHRHVAVARYFESLEDDELAGLVASHYLDAYRAAPDGAEREEAAARARVALSAAAERAISLHANSTAISLIEQALSVTSDPAERARLQVMAAEPAWATSDAEVGDAYVLSAIEWYQQNGRTAEADDAIVVLGRWQLHTSRAGGAMSLLEEAVARIDDDHATATAPRLLNQLARAYLFFGREPESREPVERGLAIAERLSLEPEIADLLVTKSWVMGAQGRYLESLLLAEGGLRLTQKHGLVAHELRARMNVSNGYITTDPRQGLEVARKGVELSERIGNATWSASLAGNEAMCAILLGRYEVADARARELDRPHVNGWARLSIAGAAMIARAFMGIASGDVEVQLEAMADEDIEPGQRRSMLGALGAMAVYAAGRLEDVEDVARTAGEGSTNASESALAAFAAAHAMIWLGQQERLPEMIDVLAANAGLGQVISTSLLQARAALAAMEGRWSDAERGYRDAIVVWRQLGMVPDIATAQLEMLRLFGDRLDDRDVLAGEARHILSGIGAVTPLARLDEIAPVASPA